MKTWSQKIHLTISATLSAASERLQPAHVTCQAERHLGRLEAEILLAHVLKKDRVWLIAHSDFRLTTLDCRRLAGLIRRREKHEPIAYILGQKEFYGLSFKVNRNVLIPRPESELLIELALSHFPSLSFVRRGLERGIAMVNKVSNGITVWDVGTGSGAIAIAIAKYLPHARMLATDISSAALTLARQNAKRHDVTNVTFLRANLCAAKVRRWLVCKGMAHDAPTQNLIIVANLPYLPTSDKGWTRRAARLSSPKSSPLQQDVVKYEPRDALFAGQTGLEIIETILRQLAAFDIHFMAAYLEFDPPQTKHLMKLAQELFPRARIKLHKDLAGLNRVIALESSPPKS